MIGTLRKHSQWLWAVIITMTIISFVYFFSPDAKIKDRAEKNYGTINGRKILYKELSEGYREASLSYFFRFGRWPARDEMSRFAGYDPDNDARRQLVFNEATRELGIHVSDAAVVQQLQRFFRDTNGFYQPQAYQNFVKSELNGNGLGAEDLERFVRHEIGRFHLAQVLGMGGKLMSTRAAEAYYQRDQEQVLTEAVLYANTNQLAKVTFTTNMLQAWFTNQQANYRIPERVQVSYIHFSPLDFLTDAAKQMASITNLATQIEAEYLQRGTNTFRDNDGKVLAPGAAKTKISDDLRLTFARQLASKKGIEVANDLFRIQPVRASNLATIAAKHSLKVQATDPFDREGPKGLFPDQFGSAAFRLSLEEPLTTPVHGEHGTFLMAFKERIPGGPDRFENVQKKVAEDYREEQAKELTMLEATKLAKAVTNGLAQGKTFKAICAENKAVAIEVPALTRASRDLPPPELRGVEVSEYRQVAFSLPAGRASSFVQTRDGGFIVFARAIVPVADAKMKQELPEFAEQLRDSRVNYVFNDWFMKELERTGMAAQIQQRRQAPAGE